MWAKIQISIRGFKIKKTPTQVEPSFVQNIDSFESSSVSLISARCLQRISGHLVTFYVSGLKNK